MSQCNLINYEQIIQQQQEQLTVIQAQLQVLLAVQGGAVAPRIRTSIEVAKL